MSGVNCLLARPNRFERLTPSLGGKCSVQLSYGRMAHMNPLTGDGLHKPIRSKVVGTVGLEPATSWSRTRRTTKLCYVPTSRNSASDSILFALHEFK